MAQQYKTEIADYTKTLEQLRAKRRQLGQVKMSLDEVTKTATGTTTREGMSKLDSALQGYNEYNVTIADLSAGLTDSLNKYVDAASKYKNFAGIEKAAKFFGAKQWAHRHRVQRLKQQGPKENLKLVLTIAADIVQELQETQAQAMQNMGGLQGTINEVVEKIARYEPIEEQLKQKLDAMEADYAALEEKNKTASPAEQAKLAVELNEKQKKLVGVRMEYDDVLTTYNQAKQALQPNREAFKSFEQMVRDLGRQAVTINEKMLNIQQLYESTPEAIEIMMKTKGMETLDQAMNVGTEKSLEMITDAAIGVADATSRRAETDLVEAAFMRQIMEQMESMAQAFRESQERVRTMAHRTDAERYGTTDAN